MGADKGKDGTRNPSSLYHNNIRVSRPTKSAAAAPRCPPSVSSCNSVAPGLKLLPTVNNEEHVSSAP